LGETFPMTRGPLPVNGRLDRLLTSRHFWLVVAMLISGLIFHYSAQERTILPFLPAGSTLQLSRHSLERILFILPITYAAFTFGVIGGLIALCVSLFIMLPRVFIASPYPADAFLETVSVAVVGGLICWLVAIRDREKELREAAMGRIAAISGVSDVLIQSLELDQILTGALEKLIKVLEVENRGGIFLLDEEAGELYLAAHRGLAPEFARAEERIRLGECLCGQAALTGQVLVTEECPDDDRHDGTGLDRDHSHMVMPLRAHEKVIGVLFLYPAPGFRCARSDVDVLTTIGNQIGVAVENALLHQDLARQLERERRLNEVAQEITSELELVRVLPTVGQLAEELVEADAGVIALLDQQRDAITYPYVHNLAPELSDVTVARGEGLAGEVMASGRPLVVEDYSAHPKAVEAFVRAEVASVLAVPIQSGDRVFGALLIFGIKTRKRFSQRDVALIAGVGRQAGIAIENAHLYDNLRFYVRQVTRAQEHERMRIARELHDDTAQALALISRRLDTLVLSGEEVPELLEKRIESLRELTSQTLQSLRRFSRDLRPSILDDLGLLPALEGLTSDLAERNGIEAKLEVRGERRRLSAETELTLFRIAQEALRNVEKHSLATVAQIRVEFGEARIRITIRDNGTGFRLSEERGRLVHDGKLGLAGMQERAQLLGGTLAMESAPGRGTKIVVEVPR
jgi:signal transduction histidine kinase